MEWELEYQDKAFVINIHIERGIPLPSWAKNEPEIYSMDEFYMSAFTELSTCRQLGMSIGPIPWVDIISFAQFAELDGDMVSIFVQVIRSMDRAYMGWVGKKKPGNA